MPLSRRLLATLLALVVLPGAAFALLLGFGDDRADSQAVPAVTSDNVELVKTLPGTAGISGVFSRTAPFFYVSGLDQLTVYDVKDPRNPTQVGRLVNPLFENEAMTLGERRRPDGSIQRFVLIGNDLVQASVGPGGIQRGRVGGGQLIVADVTNPADPRIIGTTPESGAGAVTTSTHTVACMDAACSVAYSAGDSDKFSVIDLTDLTKPKQVKTLGSPASNTGPIGKSGHHWNVDGAGIAQHTGTGGTAFFDVSDPLEPKALNGTDKNGTSTPYNDFIHHNSQRPNARAFRAGQAPSFISGNVALVTEEDYANDGDELDCAQAGSFQTWEIPDLDGDAYRARNPTLKPNEGSIKVLDKINAPVEGGGGLSQQPVGAFCSAHWFDFHQSGIVALGHYQAGLRLIDVRNAKDLKQFGFASGGATETWDAYWVPRRNADGTVVPGVKTNVIYTADATRGIDVYAVKNLPPDAPVSGDDGPRGTFPAPPQTVEQVRGSASSGGAGGPASARGCGAPTSRFAKGSRLTRRGLSLRGTARGAGCGITRVQVSVARKVGKRCRFLDARGRFGAPRSCLRTTYLRAKGRESWTLSRRVRLPAGRYQVWSRAIDARGQVERKAAKRNLRLTRVR